MTDKSKFNKVAYDNEFKKKHYKRYLFELDKVKDIKLIDHIERQLNKKAYIKGLIEQDLKKVEKN